MTKQTKHKHIQVSVEPWPYQQQTSHTLNNSQISLFQPIHSFTVHNTPIKTKKDSSEEKEIRLSKTIDRQPIKSKAEELRISSRTSSKFKKINYVKINQQNIQSNQFNKWISQDYNTLLNEDTNNFVPIKANSTTKSWMKRPIINTTYIGYYDDEKFYGEPHEKMANNKQNSPINLSKRPRTSDITKKSAQTQQKKLTVFQKVTERIGATGSYHLQKMLRLKEKLRQKNKKNFQKKEKSNSTYVKSTLNFYEQRSIRISVDRSIQAYSSTLQARKNSFDVIQKKSPEKKIDKWKQYMKLKQKNEKQQKEKNRKSVHSCKNARTNNKFFLVVGGAIYK